MIILGLLIKYLGSLLSFFKSPFVGFHIPLQISLTPYWMSGLSSAR